MAAAGQAIELADVDMEKNILREIADTATDGFYGWIAGESTAVMNIAQLPDQRAWHTS
jgi:NADPH-dependent ferric siderophore reductase